MASRVAPRQEIVFYEAVEDLNRFHIKGTIMDFDLNNPIAREYLSKNKHKMVKVRIPQGRIV